VIGLDSPQGYGGGNLPRASKLIVTRKEDSRPCDSTTRTFSFAMRRRGFNLLEIPRLPGGRGLNQTKDCAYEIPFILDGINLFVDGTFGGGGG